MLISPRITLPNRSTTSNNLLKCEIAALQEQGFPLGLAKTLSETKEAFPLRIWVVDNSGSMRTLDGHKIVETANSNDIKLVQCNRWSELQQTIEYHSQMAHLLQTPTIFRLLNHPGRVVGRQQFSIGENGPTNIDDELNDALRTVKSISPGGVTHLTQHIRDIRENIESLLPKLRDDLTKVVIVLATDGLPTDIYGRCDNNTKLEFKEALRSLEGLPIWIVIRLCTNEDEVVEFYNNLDLDLERNIDVLDDFSQEAEDVCKHNPWLNYALPLHRCREMGYHEHLFDILDERKLGLEELYDFFKILFGEEQFVGVPDLHADWKGFLKSLSNIVNKEKDEWNPHTKRLGPWIDIKILEKEYNCGF